MSTESFGGVHTASILRGIFGLLNFRVSPNMLDLINTILRELSHVAEYAVLGFLVYRSLGSRDYFRSQLSLGTWCILAAFVYSLTDELHQAFVPGRHASLLDCGIDTLGAATAILLIYGNSAFLKIWSKKHAAQRRTAQAR